MKSLLRTFRHPGLGPQRTGFALVVALTAIVLITVIVLAFFSKALLNRQVSFTSTNQIKSDMLARSALDIVIGEVRQEVLDFSTPPTNGIYLPLTNLNMMPVKTGVSAADTNTGAYTITKVTAPNTRLNPGANGKLFGSPVSLDRKSRNGRTLSQWFNSGPGLGSATLPTWTYLSRAGTAVTNFTAAEKNPTGTNYVTGRFSYTVYNVGGLLDANVAGYPSSITNVTDFGTKSSIAYAELTSLGMTTNQIDNLVAWRNAATGASTNLFKTWATGINTTNTTASKDAAAAASSGYLAAAPGDNVFFSRRDLLRYLGARADTNSVPNLTHFSRSINAPSWEPREIPDSAINYKAKATNDDSINRFIPGVRAFDGVITDYADDGTPTDREVSASDPLVQRKFSLAKLAWLGHNGPNVAAFSSSLSSVERNRAIKACFGLTWKPNTNLASQTSNAHWDYDHGNANDILLLDEVRQEKRAPDFFELLKAGILHGSLGTQPGNVAGNLATKTDEGTWEGPNGRDFEAYSSDEDRHILQIGANIIDQADADNYPTPIYMDLIQKYAGSERVFFNTVFGLENLPMLQRVSLINAMPQPHTGHPSGPMWFWMQPELWNPNDRSTAGNSTSDAKYPTPSSLRMTTYGQVYFWNRGEYPEDPTGGPLQDFGTTYFNPVIDGIIHFKNPGPNSTQPANLFDAPNSIKGYEKATLARNYADTTWTSGPKNRYPADMPWVTMSVHNNQFIAVWLGECDRNTAAPNEQYDLVPVIDTNLTFVLEYFDGSAWFPYCSFSRMDSMARNAGGSGSRWGSVGPRSYYAHPDPRTDRFSNSAGRHSDGQIPQWGGGFSVRPDPSAAVGTGNVGGRSPIALGWPRANAGATSTPATQVAFTHNPVTADGLKYLFDDWAINLAVAKGDKPASQFRYSDPDGVTRPGDAWRGDYTTGDGVGMYIQSTLPATAQRRRSVILNRPFLSIGELGYVYRDEPFKTLDLWSADSPDAGLLDLFSVSDSEAPVVAGKINPNAAPPKVLEAIFRRAGNQGLTNTTLSDNTAIALARTVTNEISLNGPLQNPAEILPKLADGLFSSLTNTATDTAYNNKSYGEAPVRALSSVADMRSWTFLVDVVAQSGKLATAATDLQDFIVEGEKRYWLHITVDRLTGEVVDKQLESVYE